MSDFPVLKSTEFISKVGIKERPYRISARAVNADNLELQTGHGSLYLNRAGVTALRDLLSEMLEVMTPQARDDSDDDVSDTPRRRRKQK